VTYLLPSVFCWQRRLRLLPALLSVPGPLCSLRWGELAALGVDPGVADLLARVPALRPVLFRVNLDPLDADRRPADRTSFSCHRDRPGPRDNRACNTAESIRSLSKHFPHQAQNTTKHDKTWGMARLSARKTRKERKKGHMTPTELQIARSTNQHTRCNDPARWHIIQRMGCSPEQKAWAWSRVGTKPTPKSQDSDRTFRAGLPGTPTSWGTPCALGSASQP